MWHVSMSGRQFNNFPAVLYSIGSLTVRCDTRSLMDDGQGKEKKEEERKRKVAKIDFIFWGKLCYWGGEGGRAEKWECEPGQWIVLRVFRPPRSVCGERATTKMTSRRALIYPEISTNLLKRPRSEYGSKSTVFSDYALFGVCMSKLRFGFSFPFSRTAE